MIELLILISLLILAIPTYIFFAICFCIVTGSSVDPDDNGLFKSKESKKKWSEEKRKNLEENKFFE